MKIIKTYFSVVLLVFIAFTATAQEEQEIPPKEKLTLESVKGTVTTINAESREITLMGSEGDLVTVVASDSIERFDEIEVNDIISFDYWTYMMAEFRELTAEELAEPFIVVEEEIKATEDMDPGAAVGAVVKAVVSIEALNRPFMRATVKGPQGNFLTIPVEDEELLQKLHIGQVLILTYAEAIAVRLDKIDAAEPIKD